MDPSAEWQHAVRSVPASPAGITSDRIELRVQAIELAERGWPLRPGTYPHNGEWCELAGPSADRADNPGSSAERAAGNAAANASGHARAEHPQPIHSDWAGFAELSATELAEWWSERPYGLLAATGSGFGAIEVDADLGQRAARSLRACGAPVPIIATPFGRWFFPTAGDALTGHMLDELAEEQGERIVLHHQGSWIPLPPSVLPHGIVHWRVKPELCAWQLPSAQYVRNALCTALASTTTEQATEVADLLTAGR